MNYSIKELPAAGSEKGGDAHKFLTDLIGNTHVITTDLFTRRSC